MNFYKILSFPLFITELISVEAFMLIHQRNGIEHILVKANGLFFKNHCNGPCLPIFLDYLFSEVDPTEYLGQINYNSNGIEDLTLITDDRDVNLYLMDDNMWSVLWNLLMQVEGNLGFQDRVVYLNVDDRNHQEIFQVNVEFDGIQFIVTTGFCEDVMLFLEHDWQICHRITLSPIIRHGMSIAEINTLLAAVADVRGRFKLVVRRPIEGLLLPPNAQYIRYVVESETLFQNDSEED